MSVIDRVYNFIPNRDHAKAAAHPEEDEEGRTSSFALEWLLDAYAERASNNEVDILTIPLIIKRLRHADPARDKYWLYREQMITA